MNMVKAAFTSYLSHLAGYVVSAATVLSAVNPKLFPPQYAFVTALASGLAVAFSHGKAVQANGASIAASVANAFTDAVNSAVVSTPATPAPIVAAVKVVSLLFVLCIMLPLLHGCASVQSFLSSPTGQTVTIAGVEVAVTTAEQKGVSAAQINSVAKAVLASDQGLVTSVAGLTTVVNAQLVKLNVPAGDVAAFQGLEIAFDAYLVAKYGNNTTVTNLQADVATFANAVIAATGG